MDKVILPLNNLSDHELVCQATEILSTLLDIQKRPMKYAHGDELDWKKNELPKLDHILDELHYRTNPEYLADVETAEQQLKLNYEGNQHIERVSA